MQGGLFSFKNTKTKQNRIQKTHPNLSSPNLHPLHWKHGFLTTGPPEKSQHAVLFFRLTKCLLHCVSLLGRTPESIGLRWCH